MIYKNVEFHNVEELVYNEDGSVSWMRVPSSVYNEMEMRNAQNAAFGAGGVELRFVIKGESATIKMRTYEDNPSSIPCFHVFRGAIQGGWEDNEIHTTVTGEIQEFVIKKAENIERLQNIHERTGYDWDPNVVRIIFNSGKFRIYDIVGDVEPPSSAQTPKTKMLCYGSSITNGLSALNSAHTWVSILSHNLNVDVFNKGMPGSCAMEPAISNFVASQGEKGNWDIATLELGINVLGWTVEKFRERAENIIKEVALRNPEKPIFVISPFYHCGDEYWEDDNAKFYRVALKEIVEKYNFKNVTYINGFDVLGSVKYMSADFIHPNIYGMQKIADTLTEILSKALNIKPIK